MTPGPLTVAIEIVRRWTRLYTWRLPAAERDERRAEIESDLWEFQQNVGTNSGPLPAALHVLVRLLAGIPDDVSWRMDHPATGRTAATLTTSASVPVVSSRERAVRRVSALGTSMILHVVGAAGVIWLAAHATYRSDESRGSSESSAAVVEGMSDIAAGAPEDDAAPSPPEPQAPIDPTTSAVQRWKGSPRRPFLTAAAAILLTAVSVTHAQTPVAVSPSSPVFDVVSVKPNRSGGPGRRGVSAQPGGRLTGSDVTAAELIRFAYEVPDFLMAGGPNWLNSDRFAVEAKAEGDPPLAQKRSMLRSLLAERFKLTTHTEMRELPFYALVMARSDGRMGPQLRRTETDCAGADQTSLEPGLGPRGPGPCGFFGFAPGTSLPAGRGGLAFRGLTMAALAKIFVPLLHRSVSDQTGLTGYFDADFDFIAELPIPPPPPGVPSLFTTPFVSVFTVLPEQLGLKLDSRRGPVEVLVIDRAEQPTPD